MGLAARSGDKTIGFSEMLGLTGLSLEDLNRIDEECFVLPARIEFQCVKPLGVYEQNEC